VKSVYVYKWMWFEFEIFTKKKIILVKFA
jgi:hypothetical protein